MKIALVTDGTWGDVLPFIFLAQELQKNNHYVTLYTNEYYRAYITSQNIPFVATTSSALRDSYLSNPDLWHPRKGVKVMGEASQKIFTESWNILEQSLPSVDLIISYTFMYAAYSIAKLHHIPCITLCISPIQVRSYEHLPTFFKGRDYNFLPHFGKKFFYTVGDRFFIDPYFKKAINSTRVSRGLKPITQFVHYSTLSYPTIGLWPEWYSKKECDQSELHLTNFPRAVEFAHDNNPELIQWIKDGEKPIVVTMGSGYRFSHDLIREVQKISSPLQRFIIIAATEKHHFLKDAHVCIIPHAKLSHLLPLCKLLIHHGGAGTVSQAVHAGIPQLVVPMSHDQPDNAALVQENNLGDILWWTAPDAQQLAQSIQKVMSNKEIRISCKKAREQVSTASDAFKDAVSLIEKMFLFHS